MWQAEVWWDGKWRKLFSGDKRTLDEYAAECRKDPERATVRVVPKEK